jgi:hypothetical protein
MKLDEGIRAPDGDVETDPGFGWRRLSSRLIHQPAPGFVDRLNNDQLQSPAVDRYATSAPDRERSGAYRWAM